MKQNSAVHQSEEARQPAAADTPLTRGQVAEQLGTSIGSVRRLEGKTLHPTKGADGVNRFDPAEVAALVADQTTSSPTKLRRSADGDLAAEAFMRFSNGLTPRDVVIELRQPPDVIEKLHRQWREAGGLWLPRAVVATLRKHINARHHAEDAVRLVTPEDLVDAVLGVLQALDYHAEQASDRADEIADLESTRRDLRRRLAKCRTELDEWEEWADGQDQSTPKPQKTEDPQASPTAT